MLLFGWSDKVKSANIKYHITFHVRQDVVWSAHLKKMFWASQNDFRTSTYMYQLHAQLTQAVKLT